VLSTLLLSSPFLSSPFPCFLHAPQFSFSLIWAYKQHLGKKYKLWRSLLCNFLQPPTQSNALFFTLFLPNENMEYLFFFLIFKVWALRLFRFRIISETVIILNIW
jgi:hypothetical protein